MSSRNPALTPLRSNASEAAVIDVGSNSVRLVVYSIDGRALTPSLNEKVMAGLGRGVAETGRLAEAGRNAALDALARFAVVLEAKGVKDVFAVGTAAVREAEDRADFISEIKRRTGITVRVLSGPEEARLSALGVLAGAPEARGVVGDLGGASLELIELDENGPGRGETFRLGPLSLMRATTNFNYPEVAKKADDALAASGIATKRGGDFYAVGGAWRALGRIDIAIRNHPIGVLHHHEMTRDEVLTVTEFVRRQSKKSLELMEEAAARRAETLPYAAAVLERVVQAGKFDRVILSALGLREGVLLERMTPEILRTDPLVASAEALAGSAQRSRQFGRALAAWIEPAFANVTPSFSAQRDAVLRRTAARLADLGGLLHPDQRVEILFDLVLRAPLVGLSHSERAYLAAATHHRYARAQPKRADAYVRLLGEDQRKGAAALGAMLRLGADLSGRSEGLLARTSLSVAEGVLRVSVEQRFEAIVTDQVRRRLDAAASALDLKSDVVVRR